MFSDVSDMDESKDPDLSCSSILSDMLEGTEAVFEC